VTIRRTQAGDGSYDPPVPFVLRRTAADLTTVEIDGEISTYHPGTDRVVMLNVTASDVFALCDGTLDEDGITGLLAGAYRADPGEVADGVRSAVALLTREDLVHRVPTEQADGAGAELPGPGA
jgi:Coenzyme PQQ synthesis protein D (PqqD)